MTLFDFFDKHLDLFVTIYVMAYLFSLHFIGKLFKLIERKQK